MATHVAQAFVPRPPAHVLAALTDVETCSRWAPVGFEVSGVQDGRLAAGRKARVAGRLIGREIAFDVRVLDADESRLRVRADGPFALDVAYDLHRRADGTDLRAEVRTEGSGLLGRTLAKATDALAASGLFEEAVRRLAMVAAEA